MALIVFLLLLNGAISAFNAWACGQAWAETKRAGGWLHVINWSGTIMSICGFLWCYVIVLGLFGTLIPWGYDLDGHARSLVTPEMFKWIFELGYMVIIFPALGTGLLLTINSWAHFYRERTFASGAVAGWNTFAQMHNMYEAVRVMPTIWRDLGGLFGGSASASGSGSSSGAGGSTNKDTVTIIVVIVVVLLALALAILTTTMILRASARSQAREQLLRMRAA